jgi:hypothetical protein
MAQTGRRELVAGMILTDQNRARELTDQQKLFVEHYTSTPGAIGNASEAARLAGYSDITARVQGAQQLAKPHVRAAVSDAARQLVAGPGVAKAVALLMKTIEDENAPLGIRVKCAQDIMDRAGVRAAPGMSLDARPQADPRQALGAAVAEMAQAMARFRPTTRPLVPTIEGESEEETDG